MLEEELYRGLRKNNPAALEQIIDTYGSCVYKLAARLLAGLGNSGDIEECCSDVFTAVWVKRKQFDPQRASLRTWVLVLARYTALDYRRKLAGRRETTGTGFPEEAEPAERHSPEAVFLEKEKRDAVMEALLALPAREREILYRRYFLEESVTGIAGAMKISRGAADSRLWRARKMLKERLDSDEERKAAPLRGRTWKGAKKSEGSKPAHGSFQR